MSRPNWDDYFMKLAFATAERATCHRHHAGAIMVKGRRVLTGGYNGAPAGMSDCLELGCLREGIKSGERTEVCRAVHAEENAVIQAAVYAVSVQGATVYCTHSPCHRCAKMLCNAGIKRFVACFDYDDSVFKDLFKTAKIEFVQIPVPSLIIEMLN